MRRDELVFLAGLMRQVPVRRLEMRSDLSALKWLAHALLDDFRALGDV
jgi:hypothetical protein